MSRREARWWRRAPKLDRPNGLFVVGLPVEVRPVHPACHPNVSTCFCFAKNLTERAMNIWFEANICASCKDCLSGCALCVCPTSLFLAKRMTMPLPPPPTVPGTKSDAAQSVARFAPSSGGQGTGLFLSPTTSNSRHLLVLLACVGPVASGAERPKAEGTAALAPFDNFRYHNRVFKLVTVTGIVQYSIRMMHISVLALGRSEHLQLLLRHRFYFF